MRIPGPWVRRVAQLCLAAGLYVVLASFAPRASAPTATEAAVSAADPLALLRAGNDRFVRGTPPPPRGPAPARPMGEPSAPPIATVLSCAESRVPTELVFDASPGQLIVVRSLGTVADKAVVASLEYGVAVLDAPVLVVMGHDACDAVRLDRAPVAESENLAFVTKALRAGRRTAGESADVRTLVLANVEQVINDVLATSRPLREAAAAHAVQVVGAYFDSSSGVVAFSDPVIVATDGSVRR